MKKQVKGAIQFDKFDTIERQIESRINAYNAGYDLVVDPDGDGSFSLSAREDRRMMPTFTITPIHQPDGVIVYEVELSFPNIYLGLDHQYVDDAEYWIHNWERAAKLATSIRTLVVDPDLEYED